MQARDPVTGAALVPPPASPRSTTASRQRLIRFYKAYNPSKLVVVDEMLSAARGCEEDLFRALVDRYGPEPDDPGDTVDPAQHADYRDRLIRFYRHYAPHKVPSVPDVLRSYRGAEAHLFRVLEAKYGPEPVEGGAHVPDGVSRILQDKQRVRKERRVQLVGVLGANASTLLRRRYYYKWLECGWLRSNEKVLRGVVAAGNTGLAVQQQANQQLREQVEFLKMRLAEQDAAGSAAGGATTPSCSAPASAASYSAAGGSPPPSPGWHRQHSPPAPPAGSGLYEATPVQHPSLQHAAPRHTPPPQPAPVPLQGSPSQGAGAHPGQVRMAEHASLGPQGAGQSVVLPLPPADRGGLQMQHSAVAAVPPQQQQQQHHADLEKSQKVLPTVLARQLLNTHPLVLSNPALLSALGLDDEGAAVWGGGGAHMSADALPHSPPGVLRGGAASTAAPTWQQQQQHHQHHQQQQQHQPYSGVQSRAGQPHSVPGAFGGAASPQVSAATALHLHHMHHVLPSSPPPLPAPSPTTTTTRAEVPAAPTHVVYRDAPHQHHRHDASPLQGAGGGAGSPGDSASGSGTDVHIHLRGVPPQRSPATPGGGGRAHRGVGVGAPRKLSRLHKGIIVDDLVRELTGGGHSLPRGTQRARLGLG